MGLLSGAQPQPMHARIQVLPSPCRARFSGQTEHSFVILMQMWTKRGHALNLTSSGEACMVDLQTQRPKITTQDGLKLKLFN